MENEYTNHRSTTIEPRTHGGEDYASLREKSLEEMEMIEEVVKNENAKRQSDTDLMDEILWRSDTRKYIACDNMERLHIGPKPQFDIEWIDIAQNTLSTPKTSEPKDAPPYPANVDDCEDPEIAYLRVALLKLVTFYRIFVERGIYHLGLDEALLETLRTTVDFMHKRAGAESFEKLRTDNEKLRVHLEDLQAVASAEDVLSQLEKYMTVTIEDTEFLGNGCVSPSECAGYIIIAKIACDLLWSRRSLRRVNGSVVKDWNRGSRFDYGSYLEKRLMVESAYLLATARYDSLDLDANPLWIDMEKDDWVSTTLEMAPERLILFYEYKMLCHESELRAANDPVIRGMMPDERYEVLTEFFEAMPNDDYLIAQACLLNNLACPKDDDHTSRWIEALEKVKDRLAHK